MLCCLDDKLADPRYMFSPGDIYVEADWVAVYSIALDAFR
jgi:hypothetical protein